MAYIICSTEEALLTRGKTPPSEQNHEDLAIVLPGQRIGVINNSVKLITNDLAQMVIAGRYTWTPGVKPIESGTVLYLNPARFFIPDDAWEISRISDSNESVEHPIVDKRIVKVDITDNNNSKTLSKGQIVSLAQHFRLEPEVVMAVLEVESSGSGFLNSGKLKILFEAHWFGKFTNDIYNNSHPHISCLTWAEARKFYVGGDGEWPRLEQARLLNDEAANKSASWGIGQIMGFNYATCGYDDVSTFIADMEISEAKQANAMFKFMESKNIIEDLRRHDWAGFAFGYNGEGYKQNNYDIKLEKAYKKHVNQLTFRDVNSSIDHSPPIESVRSPFDPNQPIDWKDFNCRVSKYFTVGEVTQNDLRRVPKPGSPEEKNCLRLAKELDKVREAWGAPIGVTSWYRPEPINTQVGGVSNSQHIYGAAADIYTMDSDGFSQRDHEFEQWLDKKAWKNRGLGYGISSGRGFTHVDLRQGSPRWNY